MAGVEARVEAMTDAERMELRESAQAYERGQALPRGFRIEYSVGRPEKACVDIEIGFGPLVDADHQSIELDDPRLAFTVGGDFSDALTLMHLRFNARAGGKGLQQNEIRKGGVVSVLRSWAKVARTIKRSEIDELLANMSLSVQGEHDFDSVITKTEEHLAKLIPTEPSRTRSRRRGEDANELLERVVARYRELIAQGHPTPRKQISEEENYHSAHIGRLLVKARKQGLLGPARVGKAGEEES